MTTGQITSTSKSASGASGGSYLESAAGQRATADGTDSDAGPLIALVDEDDPHHAR